MCEASDNMQNMNQRLLHSVKQEDSQVYDDIQEWAQAHQIDTLFIFDNCDSILHSFKDNFQSFLQRLIQKSEHLKIVMTAQIVTIFTDYYEAVPIAELKTRPAARVLMKIAASVSDDDAVLMAKLVGKVPLPLQVVGASLLPTLSPKELPRER